MNLEKCTLFVPEHLADVHLCKASGLNTDLCKRKIKSHKSNGLKFEIPIFLNLRLYLLQGTKTNNKGIHNKRHFEKLVKRVDAYSGLSAGS